MLRSVISTTTQTERSRHLFAALALLGTVWIISSWQFKLESLPVFECYLLVGHNWPSMEEGTANTTTTTTTTTTSTRLTHTNQTRRDAKSGSLMNCAAAAAALVKRARLYAIMMMMMMIIQSAKVARKPAYYNLTKERVCLSFCLQFPVDCDR